MSWVEVQLPESGREDSTVPTTTVVQGSSTHLLSTTGSDKECCNIYSSLIIFYSSIYLFISLFLCYSDVKLDIFNFEEVKNSSNVMGIIRGSVEPGEAVHSVQINISTPPILACNYSVCVCTDRYVIYGNHRDSWVHGAIDPSSGTSVMLEISRVLGKMVKQGETNLIRNERMSL